MRIIGAVYGNGATVSYTYDDAGNRLTKTSIGLPFTVFEDAEDTTVDGWDIYDGDPPGAAIANTYDALREIRVIKLSGAATANGYRLRNDDFSNWDDIENNIIEWSMTYDEGYVVYIAAQTKDGFRYIYYTSAETDRLGAGTYVHHGLGSASRDGTWHTITRDFETDLRRLSRIMNWKRYSVS